MNEEQLVYYRWEHRLEGTIMVSTGHIASPAPFNERWDITPISREEYESLQESLQKTSRSLQARLDRLYALAQIGLERPDVERIMRQGFIHRERVHKQYCACFLGLAMIGYTQDPEKLMVWARTPEQVTMDDMLNMPNPTHDEVRLSGHIITENDDTVFKWYKENGLLAPMPKSVSRQILEHIYTETTAWVAKWEADHE